MWDLEGKELESSEQILGGKFLKGRFYLEDVDSFKERSDSVKFQDKNAFS
jgi:hypothetical protein